MNGTMISVRALSMRLSSGGREVNVLTDVSLDVPAGQFLAIAGPSGSGKSTLLGLIAGLDQPTAGRIEVAGVEITGLDEDGLARFRRDRIGYVFQSFHLLPTLTAAENVAVPLELAGETDAAARAGALLAEVGLAERAPPLPGAALGRRAAARGGGPRDGATARAAPGRRAHRQSRLGHRQADHRAAGGHEPPPRQPRSCW